MGDVPLTLLRFRCSNCRSSLTDFRVHREDGHRGAALEAPRREVVEGHAGQGPASVRMPWCVGQIGSRTAPNPVEQGQAFDR